MAIADRVVDAAAGSLAARGARIAEGVDRVLRAAVREPLTHFFAAGLIFYLLTLVPWAPQKNEIVVGRDTVAQIARQYRLQYGVLPTPDQLAPLIDRYIHDEVLYRQGLALSLDKDDQVVKRRVVQKMGFLTENITQPAEPTPAQLRAYYETHRTQYTVPARVSFSHIYFSADNGGDKAAVARAKAVLATLKDTTTRAPDLGDPFPDLYDYANFGPEQMDRLFGHSDFSRAIFKVQPGHWAGPFQSGYGWHLVYVDSRTPAAVPPLDKIRDQVRSDYLTAKADAANLAAFQKLESHYRIVRAYAGEKP